jgi:hypothetical protein
LYRYNLVRLLYPALSSYMDPDTVAFPRHSLSRAALTTSGAPIFLLDALTVVVVFYAPAQPGSPAAALPFPPPQRSKAGDSCTSCCIQFPHSALDLNRLVW